MGRLLLAFALVLASAPSARAGVVLLGSERSADDKVALDAARQTAPAFSFADEDSADAAEQLRHADVILAVGARALAMARTVAPETPLVYAMVPAADVQAGKSVTGVALEVPAYAELAQWKQLRWDGVRVGVVQEKGAPVAGTNKAAAALGVTLTTRVVDGPAHVGAAVDELAPKVDAVWITTALPQAAAAKWRGRVALLGGNESATAVGALFSLAPDAADIGRRAARLALGIAGRAPAARLPMPPPETSPGALTLNAAAATALGIELPDPIVKKARKVYH
ncbi:MAG TPA: ABC transporter substrate binding protein [Polyangia bacterium]